MRCFSIVALLVVVLTLVALPAFAIRCYVNPSIQTNNTSPDGSYNEGYSMQDVADRLVSKLSSRGFETRDSNWLSLEGACNDAVNWGANSFYALHTNAAGSGTWYSAHGTDGFYYESSSGWYDPNDRNLSERCVHKCVEKFNAWGRGYDRGSHGDYSYMGFNFYVLSHTPNMNSVLIEGLFHTNYDDTQVLISAAGKDAYAQAIYEAVCDYYGWSYNNPTPPPSSVPMASTVAVGNNADGRLEIFARGTDGACWHNWQTVSGGWSGWNSMGGGITDVPSVVSNTDGRMEVFVRGTDGAVYHGWQTSPNGGWYAWAGIGGSITGSPAVGKNSDGHLEVFARGSSGEPLHSWCQPNGVWTAFYGMGGAITDYPVVGTNADGRLELFARGTNGLLYHNYQSSGAWSGWWSMGLNVTDVIAVGRNTDGRMELFARGSDNAAYRCYQVSPNAGWTGWYNMGGIITGRMCVATNQDGHLEVFHRGTNGAIYNSWRLADGTWTAWSSMGGSASDSPSVGRNADGRLELFARFTDGYIWHCWQITPNGGWSGWARL